MGTKSQHFPERGVLSTFVLISGVALFAFFDSIFSSRLTPIISIEEGSLQGRTAHSRDGREYWQFLSIPYAQPPLGHLRFQPPVSIEPWNGTKPVQTWPPFCVQFEVIMTQKLLGQEDCLYLNVFSLPIKKESSLLPVLVHFHGGGFIFASSSIFQPDYLMDEDLVVVTLNYRLGPLGFLNFDHDPKSDNVDLPRGNMGLKDQLLALKWIQRNIIYFGGDPNRVTLIGDSAGGMSAHLHILSSKSHGLFHRAISQSGSALSPWGFTPQPRQLAMQFMRKLGCSTENNSAAYNCLYNYDPWKMAKMQICPSHPTLPRDHFSPSVESVISDDTFLDKHPLESLKSGQFSKVPFILGVNSGDGAMRTAKFEAIPHTIPLLKANWSMLLKNVVQADRLTPLVANLAKDFYFGRDTNWDDVDSEKFIRSMTKLCSDVMSFVPTHNCAKGHAKFGAPTYLFYYDYLPKLMIGSYSVYRSGYVSGDWLPVEIKIPLHIFMDWVKEKILGRKETHKFGVAHAEELAQLWNLGGFTKYFFWGDQEFSKSFVKVLAEFAHGRNDLKFKEIHWPTLNAHLENQTDNAYIPYMKMDNSGMGKVITEPFSDRVQFWNSVGFESMN